MESDWVLEPTEDFRAYTTQAFKQLKIARVVLVDDLAATNIDAAAIMKAALTSEEAKAKLQLFFDGIDISIENSALGSQLTVKLDQMPGEEVVKLKAALDGVGPSADAEDVALLTERIPKEFEVIVLSPEKWAQQQEELLNWCSEDKRTLFLFDQDLDVDGMDLGFSKGAEIIKNIQDGHAEHFGSRWFCGIISHTLKKGDEVERWKLFETEFGISLRFFMPIAKENLRAEGDFFLAIYRTLINIYCEHMKKLTEAGLQKSLQAALERFDALDPLDFEHIIVKSSEKEGVSELETLLRVYGIIHRDQVKLEFLKEAMSSQFSDAAIAVKSIADVRRNVALDARERLLKLRVTEVYEPANLVNGFNDPLRNGDVFEATFGTETEQFILIAQPCDLMVRKNGQRSREDNFKVAVVAPIEVVPANSVQHRKPDTFLLPNFGDDGNEVGIVSFAKATVANLRVLDLAVMHKSGHCDVEPKVLKSEAVGFASRSWAERAKEIAKYFDKIAKQVETARKEHGDPVADLIAKAITPRAAMSKKFAELGTYQGSKFSYPLKRVNRVRDPLAASLLSALGAYLSRDAYEHDYSEVS
ncbi:hypothetical protein HFO10_17115 [Rhizobium laguerreae]|uniref:hypothetical protein n=1 Tax=Rhizobium laguerreae TaxID=1076926 RepID=UPI001C926A13|nr:hypothetical protein [Rhizobium laguerreae]MBY3297644.1 hypothetical protein [Rhizobium laguerreae]